jgi:hypothetical protein
MKTYNLEVTFTFRGMVTVKADNRKEAIQTVEEDFGLVMGGSPHTTNDESIVNWDFNMHPEKNLVSIS